MIEFTKDPAAVLDYDWNWTAWLQGDTIASVVVDVVGVVLDDSSHTDTVVTAWLSGGSVGVPAKATARITTATNRVDERTIKLKIRNL